MLMTVLNFSTTQNSSDNLPSYLQTTIITQMLSIGGQGGINRESRFRDAIHGVSTKLKCHFQLSFKSR